MAGEQYLAFGSGTGSDLSTFNNTVAQNDPFGITGRSLIAWQPNTATWTPQQSALTAFTKAFAGGLLHGYGQQRAADQTNSLIGILPQLRADPMSVQAPEGVDANAFATFKGNQILRNVMMQEQRQLSLAEMLDKVAFARAETGAKKMGEADAELELAKGGMVVPGSALYQGIKDKESGADSLRKELSGLPEVKNFKEVANRFDTLKKGLLDKNAITDTEFAVSLAKIFDPSSVVRETESGQVIDSQSMPSSILGRINKAMTGEQALDTQARLALLGSAKRNYDTQQSAYLSQFGAYENLAKNRGIAPLDVTGPKLGSTYSFGQPELTELAARFPATPEGREAFKNAVGLLK